MIQLDNEEDILTFMENKPEIYQPDYVEGIFNKGTKLNKNMD